MAKRIDRAPRAQRRRRTPEFKVEAVRLMEERLRTGLTLERVSQELEIGPDLLRSWAKAVAAAPAAAPPAEIFPGPGKRRRHPQTPDGGARAAARGEVEATAEELARLRRENERLRQERDFLKKAAAFFAKESR